MKKLLLTIFAIVSAQITFALPDAHTPNQSIGYTDGNQPRAYTVPPNGLQSSAFLNMASSTINGNVAADVYLNFLYDTNGKSVYLVYTIDGSAPTKSNGTVVNCYFSKYNAVNMTDRTWAATIPGQAPGIVVKYVFYASNGTLADGFARAAIPSTFETSWTEGSNSFTYTVDAVLATDLLDFKAIKQSGNVELFWLTGTPKDDNQFSIERSKEGVNFDALTTMQATQKSKSKGNYSFSDAAPFKGINYYRLKSMDNAGVSTYSKVIAVDFSKRISVSIYPNPASNKTTLDINSEKEDNVLIQVTDVVGRLHKSFNQAVVQGNNAISLDAASLPNGIYFIRLNDEVQKFIKN